MSRKQSGAMEFGSDSFLDVIANIVGILIILIVIAGLRAGRLQSVVPGPAHPPATEVSDQNPELGGLTSHEDSAPRPLAFVAPPVPVPLPEPDATTPAAIAALQRALAELHQKRERMQLELITMDEQGQRTRRQLEAMTSSFQSDLASGAAVRDRLPGLRASLEKNRLTLAALQKQYDEARRRGNPSKRIQHRLTPVGRTVTGKEVHFRLAQGRVAKVPVEKLVKRMREDVVRSKAWLMKVPVHRGTVGPVDGFSMKYVVHRELSTTFDGMRRGYGQIRLMLGGWKIEPAGDLQAETERQALRVGSAFDRALASADPGTTMTFWVYPDSFDLYRKLQAAVHEQGLRVAARPLPFGMPIAGSPHGTRSSGQ